jgi:TatD DNase family protein
LSSSTSADAIAWVETHAHLSDAKFDDDRDAALERAKQAGVTRLIEIADGPSEWPKARALAERHAGFVWWAAGIHPYYADQASPDVWAELERLAKDPRFVAVGEIGLDYAKCPIPRERQIQTFTEGWDLADRLDKPVIIHCREAYDDLMPLLRARRGRLRSVPGVVHCFSGNAEHAREIVELGFYLGVDGPVTYPNAHGLRAALDAAPAESLVLETDSPYLPPQSRRGQRNEPACLPEIGLRLSAHKRLAPREAARLWTANAHRLFSLPPA